MGITIHCVNPLTGEVTAIEANGVGASGGTESQYPALRASRVNVSIQDVQQTIAEGRAKGITPFSLDGPGTGVGQGRF